MTHTPETAGADNSQDCSCSCACSCDLTSDEKLQRQIMLYPGYIFDMDGTIVDSEPCHHDACNHLLRELKLPELPLEILASYAGLPEIPMMQDVISRLKAQGCSLPEHITPEYLATEKTRIYNEIYMPQAPAFASICALIRELAASGRRLALATSSPQIQARYFMQKYGLESCFASIISGEMVEHGKPAPDIFLLAAQTLNLKPQDCLVFEDGQHGLDAAAAGDFDAVKVAAGRICATFFRH